MRTTICLLALIASLAVVVGSASATRAPSVAASADTCAFSTTGHKIGCLEDAQNCSLLAAWTRGQWQFMAQENDQKAIGAPRPSVAAKRIHRGVWMIVRWNDRRRIGRVAATNGQQTRWRIKNERGNVVATARGPDGARIGMVILYYDADVFC